MIYVGLHISCVIIGSCNTCCQIKNTIICNVIYKSCSYLLRYVLFLNLVYGVQIAHI